VLMTKAEINPPAYPANKSTGTITRHSVRKPKTFLSRRLNLLFVVAMCGAWLCLSSIMTVGKVQ